MQTQPKVIEFRKKRSFDQVINTTFTFVKYNFKKFFQVFFTIGGPVILLTGILYGAVFYGISSRATDINATNTSFSDIFGIMGIGVVTAIIFGLVLWLGYLILMGTVYEFMALYNENHSTENITPAAVWERLKGDLPRLIGSTLLFMLFGLLILGGIFLLATLFGGLIGYGFLESGTAAIILMPIAFFLMIFFIMRLMIVFPVLIFEKAGALQAVKRSYTLTAGAWWRTFAIVFIMGIIQSLISYIFLIPQLAIGISAGLATASGDIENSSANQVISAVSSGLYFLVAFTLSSLSIIAVGIHYFSLVEEKENSGLLNRISEIGQSPSNPDASLETY